VSAGRGLDGVDDALQTPTHRYDDTPIRFPNRAVGTRSCAIRRCTSRPNFRFCPTIPRTVREMLAFQCSLDVLRRIARERVPTAGRAQTFIVTWRPFRLTASLTPIQPPILSMTEKPEFSDRRYSRRDFRNVRAYKALVSALRHAQGCNFSRKSGKKTKNDQNGLKIK
jgi:hypothetical protein